jgi:hypothetical protein
VWKQASELLVAQRLRLVNEQNFEPRQVQVDQVQTTASGPKLCDRRGKALDTNMRGPRQVEVGDLPRQRELVLDLGAALQLEFVQTAESVEGRTGDLCAREVKVLKRQVR